MDPVVILGSGLAGYGVLRSYRRKQKTAPVTLVTADAGDYYSKPALSSALADGRSADDLVLTPAAAMGEALKAQIVARSPVMHVDVRRQLVLAQDAELRYSQLVLALGSTPVRPQLGGDASGEVVCVNSLAEYAEFRRRLASAQRVVILGGGLIGCEFANDLASAGVQVHVVEQAPQILPRLLPAPAASALADRLSALGVVFHLGQPAVRVDRRGGTLRLLLGDGQAVDGELILAALGLTPRTQIARDAGLAVRRGIVVDRSLRTSNPQVFALGDCAELDGLVLPFVEPMQNAARALGATLAGHPTAVSYPAMPVRVKTPAWPTVVSPPAPGLDVAWECTAVADGMRCLCHDAHGRLVGLSLHGVAVAELPDLQRRLPPLLAP